MSVRRAVSVFALAIAAAACRSHPAVVLPPVAAPTSPAMTARDAQGLSMSSDVLQQFAAMMRHGVRVQIEPAACVASYRQWGNPPRVDLYALTLADVDSADELHIWYHGPHLCADSMPSVHGHVSREYFVPFPSQVDSATALLFRAPFHVLLYRALADSVFGVKLQWSRP